MLEVDNRVMLPELTHTRLVATSGDVIHSLACPALGIKCDAYPDQEYSTDNVLKYVEYYIAQCLLYSNLQIYLHS
ncbi:hypothetical protein LLEC1_05031 [Akanthomyces lecanii]|uniref:Cytochrome c oxidase polypeptide II n=1 Tax=Cordyceps confragosa TaxID=2714763 RepID=A0A179ITJ6_CORDF|nr:hypothetical protein LLEC1_05031 [Akanthomyces lecanii]